MRWITSTAVSGDLWLISAAVTPDIGQSKMPITHQTANFAFLRIIMIMSFPFG
jgi:hypothetical protein